MAQDVIHYNESHTHIKPFIQIYWRTSLAGYLATKSRSMSPFSHLKPYASMLITHSITMRDCLLGKESKGRSWCWRPKSRFSCIQLAILSARNGDTSSGITKREFTLLALLPNQVRGWFASSFSINLIMQAFRLSNSIMYRTSFLKKDSRVPIGGNLIMTASCYKDGKLIIITSLIIMTSWIILGLCALK